MVDYRSKSSDCQFSSKEYVPKQLRIMKVGQGTLINLKGSCQPCVSRAQYLFRRTMVHQEAVQMESGKLHSFLPYPKCKVAVANPKFVNTRVSGMNAASRISLTRQASSPPSSLRLAGYPPPWMNYGFPMQVQLSWEPGRTCQLFWDISKDLWLTFAERCALRYC